MPPHLLTAPGWPLARSLALLVAGLLIVISLIVAAILDTALELRPPRDRYNFAAWEARNLPAKWLYELGELFRSDRSIEQQDSDIARFFELTGRISQLEQQGAGADPSELRAAHKERDTLENRVEDTIEDRIGVVLRDLGIRRKLLILPTMVWPPVDFEFTESPRSLATSPRDKIELRGTELLRDDLTIEDVERIEDEVQEKRNLSALAAPTSGIGAYPSIVDYLRSYQTTLEVAAHEWMHNYLFFRPLGFNYYESNDLRTMNETVADLVGHEVADEVLRRWPLPPEAPQDPAPAPPAADPSLDAGAELRKLRGEVDVLLGGGKIDEAEALMEQRRQELAARGFFLRKINQAYFAFNNLYAGESGSPAATNPIGPKIDELRRRSASLAAFVNLMAGITSLEQLDEALAALP